MTETHIHRFPNGVTAKATFSPGNPASINIEWSAKPTKEILPEYFQWRDRILEAHAQKTGLKILCVTL